MTHTTHIGVFIALGEGLWEISLAQIRSKYLPSVRFLAFSDCILVVNMRFYYTITLVLPLMRVFTGNK